jgi:photosystem II stability/assembly factor-like uncharacterized protein
MRYLLFMLLLGYSTIAFSQSPKKEVADTFNYNKQLQALKWRCIGPFRGGRSVCATGVPGNTAVYYMGTTGGGLWKTDDMGLNWNNISDGYFKTGSVGAVAVPESDANVVYVGMGEHAIRGVKTHHGDGVYKSIDAGKTWAHMGLTATQHIARIVVHPKNPDLVYVAAQGPLYSKSPNRGIYKSSNGGATWKQVLFINDSTGCAELSMDMNNPRIMYAAMWEHGRKPWQIKSGGPASGLYKSEDGGDTWTKLTEGLPEQMGKMSIAVCRSNSDKVYALIESDFSKEAGGLYVSTNAGQSWSHVTNNHRLIQRAWYYIELFPDPNNENTLYVLSAPALKSTDGGATWEDFSGTHGDYHNLWINPQNSANMIISDDGGSAITFNGGKSWSSQNNQPTAQFYRINVDNLFPYNIYGGQQDNSSVKIASRSLASGDITTNDWTWSAGGESAFLAFDPNNPQQVMGGSYQGTIELLDTRAKASTSVMAAPIQYLGKDAKDMKYRYNWNAPIIWSQHEPGTFYHGAQVLLRTTDKGKTWTEASPDLTRNEKSKQGQPGVPFTNEAVGAENYGTLSYVLESPQEKGVLLTGSDDGLVHITRDNGKTWQNITPPGLAECLINAIEVSPHSKSTIYIATSRYKFNDHTPGLYKSNDYGKSWQSINNGLPATAFTRVVREDAVQKDLLFAGTETGLYISYNGGQSWSAFQLNLPITPITDLRIHQGNLIASTSGRSFWILDDLSLIRQYKKIDSSFKLYQPAATMLISGYSEMDGNTSSFTGLSSRGINPATGLVMYYQLPKVKTGEILTLTIADANGHVVRKYSSKADSTYKRYEGAPPADPVLPVSKGVNRFVWNLRHATMPGVPNVYVESSYRGHKVIPGTYTLKLTYGDSTVSTQIDVLANPLYKVDATTYNEYTKLMRSMENEVTSMHQLVNKLFTKREQLEALLKELPHTEANKSLRTQADSLVARMKTWDEEMVQRKSKAYDDVENFPNKFTANYLFLINQTESEIPQINQANLDLLQTLNSQWQTLQSRGLHLLNNELPALNKKLWEAGVGAVWKE